MADQQDQQNQQIGGFVDNIWDTTLKRYKEENLTNVGMETRSSSVIETDNTLEKQKPFFSSLLNSAFSNNNALVHRQMMIEMEAIFRRVLDEKEESRKEEINGLVKATNGKLLDLNIINDRLDTNTRQDNLILIGQEEPSNNYTQYGYETQEELENLLIEAASKVDIIIKPEEISTAHRIGRKPVTPGGAPKKNRDGTKVARPILYKLNKRAKKTEILRAKKALKNDHDIKVAEDVTPQRKKLCEYVNSLSSVKVAYPESGKICIRLKDSPTKVSRVESVKDLISLRLLEGDIDWNVFGLGDIMI